MKRLALLLCLAVTSVIGAAPAPADQKTEPRLILLIAIDQFRYDYLTRFRAEYTQGFHRLLTDGAVFTDANLEHYPTVTAIGHATMLTGATPSVSGIVGNDWYDRASGAMVTSVSDASTSVLGAPSGSGASPRRLLVSTVGDELKMASRAARGSAAAPKVIGISLKDRSAILPAGRSADYAFWWSTKNGAFVTSTYYTPALPAWAAAFNAQRRADAWADKPWSLLAAPATLLRTMPSGGDGLYEAVYGSPFGSELLVDFATEAITQERLGQRGVTDLLSLSLSSNDAVGHAFGPDSTEVHDMAVRTDRLLGTLLGRVDRLVGLRNTLIALTADHGVAPLPEALVERSMPGGRLASKDVFDPIQQALSRTYGEGKWVLATAGSSPYFNETLMQELHVRPADARATAAGVAVNLPHVARVYTRDQLLAGAVANDRIGERVLRGFNPQRSGDLEILFEPYWLRQAQGTTHGTPYSYDAHIPLILMGARIRPGEYVGRVALNDLAPTLATLARVEIPSGSVGRVLTEAVRPELPEPTAAR